MKEILLTDEECARIAMILACHIDLTLEPELKEAAARGQTERIMQLTEGIAFEKQLMNKF